MTINIEDGLPIKYLETRLRADLELARNRRRSEELFALSEEQERDYCRELALKSGRWIANAPGAPESPRRVAEAIVRGE